MHIKIVPLVPQLVLHIDRIFLFDLVQEIAQLVRSFRKTIDLDDLNNRALSRPGSCPRIHIGRSTALIPLLIGRGRLRHTCENFVVDVDHILLI